MDPTVDGCKALVAPAARGPGSGSHSIRQSTEVRHLRLSHQVDLAREANSVRSCHHAAGPRQPARTSACACSPARDAPHEHGVDHGGKESVYGGISAVPLPAERCGRTTCPPPQTYGIHGWVCNSVGLYRGIATLPCYPYPSWPPPVAHRWKGRGTWAESRQAS